VLVEILLAEQAVAAQGQPLVGGEEHDRVGEPALPLEGGEHAAQLRIHALDERVVVGQLLGDRLLSQRPGQELLVADGEVAVVEGMLGKEVGRRGRLVAVVPPADLGQRLPRVVRRRERAPREERLVAEALHERLGGGADDLR
jgi:hypothetical protein